MYTYIVCGVCKPHKCCAKVCRAMPCRGVACRDVSCCIAMDHIVLYRQHMS